MDKLLDLFLSSLDCKKSSFASVIQSIIAEYNTDS